MLETGIWLIFQVKQHLNPHYLLYHGLMITAWILSVALYLKGQRRFLPLCILLTVTVAMELIVAWLYSRGLKFVWLYHFYAIVEYTLCCIYFMQIASFRYRSLIIYSILLFALASASISYWYYHFESFPGANINTEGVLICFICTYVLMNLDIHLFDAIHKHPDFWICLGLLIFFVGTFFSNGLYEYLSGMNRDLANRLFDIINKPLNLILYSCFIIGFICAIPRKSTLRLF